MKGRVEKKDELMRQRRKFEDEQLEGGKLQTKRKSEEKYRTQGKKKSTIET